MCSKNKQTKEAIIFFENSLKIKEDYRSYYNLGVEYFKSNHLEKAKENIIYTIEKNPLWIHSYLLLGQIYSNQHEFKLAIEVLTKALKIESNNKVVILALISLHFHCNQHRTVAKYLKKLEEIGGNDTIVQKIKAKLYLETGNILYSISVFKKIVSIDKESLSLKEIFKQNISKSTQNQIISKNKELQQKKYKTKKDILDISLLHLFNGNFADAISELEKIATNNKEK